MDTVGFSFRGEYIVADGTTISLTAAFTVAYVDGNKKIPDGKETLWFLEQAATPEILFIECKGILSSSGTLLTITEMFNTSELDNSLPTFTSSLVAVRTTSSVTYLDNMAGLNGFDIIMVSGQSGASGLGKTEPTIDAQASPASALHPLMYFMTAHDNTAYPEETRGKIGPVTLIPVVGTIPSGWPNAGSPIAFQRSSMNMMDFTTEVAGTSTGIAGGFARKYIENGHNNGRPVLIVGYAQGGSGFIDTIPDWRNWRKISDGLFTSMVDGNNIATSDGKSKIVAHIHAQGEADTAPSLNPTFKVDTETFLSDLKTSLSDKYSIQSRLELNTIPTVLHTMAPEWSPIASAAKTANNNIIKGIPDDVAFTATADSELPYAFTSDYTGFGDDIHIEGHQLVIFGYERTYAAWLNALVNIDASTVKAPTVPQVFKVISNKAQIKIHHEVSVGYPVPLLNIQITLSIDPTFVSPVIDETGIAGTDVIDPSLYETLSQGEYIVRLRGTNLAGDSDWSTVDNRSTFYVVSNVIVPTAEMRLPWPGVVGTGITQESGKVIRWDDTSGNGRDVVIFFLLGGNSDITWAAGVDDSALAWSGTAGKFAMVEPAISYTLGITVIARVYVTTSGLVRNIFGTQGDLAPDDKGWGFLCNGNVLTLWTQREGFTLLSFDLAANSMLDKWITVAFTYDVSSGDGTFYAGDDDTTFSAVATRNLDTDGVTIFDEGILSIGALSVDEVHQFNFLGRQADVSFWIQELNITQLNAHMQTWDNDIPLPLGITGV